MKHVFDWSSYQDAGVGDAYADIPKTGGDFARAISVCINSRQCEAKQQDAPKGLMCPSYRVTHDKHLSTGGRVSLLKAALNDEQGESALLDDSLAQAMALCVACKGCKRECENEVDMAMIKAEYLAQRHKHQGASLRTRLLANISKNLYHYSFLKSLLRLRNKQPAFAKLTEIAFGISAQRQIPEPVTQAFSQRKSEHASEESHTEVVLLIDTFTNNFAPENAEAAIAVLNRAGYKVITTQPSGIKKETDRPLCCGRTHIANGLVEQAKLEAKRMLSVLLPHVEAGRKIIGLEPACLLAIRDDYKFLGLGEQANKVAAQAILFEEFIAREKAAKRFNLELRPVDTNGQALLVHGHCHQKAVGAMKSMRKVLKLIPGLNFQFIDASCCGMAGSFGIEKEHADIAMQMAELSLLPTLREQPQARIVANGFSCQHQIKEGVGRPSLHIARFLQEAMPEKG